MQAACPCMDTTISAYMDMHAGSMSMYGHYYFMRVQATVAEDEEHFQRVVEALVAQFQGPAGSRLLARRGASVVRRRHRCLATGRFP